MSNLVKQVSFNIVTLAEHQFSIRKASLDDVEAISVLTDAAYAKYIPLIGRKPQPMTTDYSKDLAIVYRK